MANPWDDAGGHSVVDKADGIVRCTTCGKWATDERKLDTTRCNDDDDRRTGGHE